MQPTDVLFANTRSTTQLERESTHAVPKPYSQRVSSLEELGCALLSLSSLLRAKYSPREPLSHDR